jgi:BASS family bile acid:Na+ symporter
MIALFFGFLGINYQEFKHLKQNWPKMLILVFLHMLLLPAAVFYLFAFLEFELQVGLFLVTAVSSAMVNPAIAGVLKLNVFWATVFVATSSIVLPFSLPLLVRFLLKIEIDLDTMAMFVNLIKLIFIPAVLALLVRYYSAKATQFLRSISSITSVISILLLLTVILAENKDFVRANLFSLLALQAVLYNLVVFAILFLVGYFTPGFALRERLTNSYMFGIMNSGVCFLIAANYFTPGIFLVAFFSEIGWIISQQVFPYFVNWKIGIQMAEDRRQ